MPAIEYSSGRVFAPEGLRAPAQLDLFAMPVTAPAPPKEPLVEPPSVAHVRELLETRYSETAVMEIVETASEEDTLVEVTEPAEVATIDPPAVEAAPAPVFPSRAPDLRQIEWFSAGDTPSIAQARRGQLNWQAQETLSYLERHQATPTPEQLNQLAQYSGTGGIGNSFNEYYTTPELAAAVWGLAAKAGFAGGAVLEPSCGTGVFLRTAPLTAVVTGIEMDAVSAKIADLIHTPAGHEIHHTSFELAATSDPRRFQMVLGNPPFGIRGSTAAAHKRNLSRAEEYFLDTALDKTLPDGIVAMILPTGVMDGANHFQRLRADMIGKAEFIGAWRLPNTAFMHAHTNVTTDIVLLRKREDDIVAALPAMSIEEREAAGLWDEEVVSGNYFSGRGAGNILGAVAEGWRARANMGQDFMIRGDLAEAIQRLNDWQPALRPPRLTFDRLMSSPITDDARERIRRAILAAAKSTAQHGAIVIVGGQRYQFWAFEGERPHWTLAPAALPEVITIARELGEMVLDLAARPTDSKRQELAEALHAFIDQWGVPSRNRDIKEWIERPFLPDPGRTREEHRQAVQEAQRVVGMFLGAIDSNGRLSDLVTGASLVQHTMDLPTTMATMAATLDFFTIEDVMASGQFSEAEVVRELEASTNYAVERDGRRWVARDRYLSGDLWPKFDAAIEGANDPRLPESIRDRLASQATALEQAINPASLEDVEITMASGFVTPADLTAWLQDRADQDLIAGDKTYGFAQAATVTYDRGYYLVTPPAGVTHRSADNDLISDYLNREGVKKTEIPRVDALNDEFRTFALTGPIRQAIERRYNRTYRGFAQRNYPTDPITIPGLNPDRKLNGYHFAALRWALDNGRGIIAYDVGLGKTTFALLLTRIAVAMGRASNPAFFVPLNVVAHWEAEAKSWFPDAKILVIGETKIIKKDGTVSAKSDSAAVIRQKLQSCRQNNHDFVFITEPAWNKIDLSPEKKAELINEDFWVQRGEALGHAGTKRVNKAKEAFTQNALRRSFADREESICFEDLKFDMLIGDELHRYKNLFTARNRWGSQPKFLGGSGQSNRAHDTYLKASALREATGGAGIYGLTASPSKNSPLEIFSLISHVAPEAFERLGIKNVEEFLDRFCEFELQPVLNLQGEIEEATVVAGFKNLHELLPVMNRYIYRRTAKDVGLKIPEPEPVMHIIEMTDEQKEVYEDIRSKIADNAEEASQIHIFKALDMMSKASLDLGLIDSTKYQQAHSPIIQACVETAANAVRDTGDGQIIFCDYIQLHEKIKAALVAIGVPATRIAIMNARTVPRSEDRYQVSEAYNRGKYDVVIGNAPVIGESINLQVNTGGTHVLNIPWDPDTLKQMRGRGRRQGNKRDIVQEHAYFDAGGVSAYRWQILEGKREWAEVLWSGEKKAENPASTAVYSRTELMIMLSADPVAARAKYEADQQAAEARFAFKARDAAASEFKRLQELHRSLVVMKPEQRDGETGKRLARALAVQTERLADNKFFSDKSALEAPSEVLYLPRANIVIRRGDALTISSADPAKPNQLVVTEVNSKEGQIETTKLRVIGKADRTIKVEELEGLFTNSGTILLPYEQVNRPYILSALISEPPGQKSRITDLASLAAFGDEWMEANYDALQRHVRRSIKAYAMTEDSFAVRVNADDPKVFSRFMVERTFDQAEEGAKIDILLPTQANKALLMDLAVKYDRTKQVYIRTDYHSGGKPYDRIAVNINGHEAHDRSTAVNPNQAIAALQNLYGRRVATTAAEAARHDALNTLEKATEPSDIFQTAIRLVNMGFYTRFIPWDNETVWTMAERFQAIGALDVPLNAAVHIKAKGSETGLSKAYLRHALDSNDVRDFPERGTVRFFLQAIARDQELENDIAGLVNKGEFVAPTKKQPAEELTGPGADP